jgi:phospholipid/cholesterol/gamma-HCH transport system substrate-binding protein
VPAKVRLGILLAVPALLAAGLVGVWAESGPGSRVVVADFAEAPGLYKGNHVDVLGVPVGHVISITARPGDVEVRMAVSDTVRLPADVGALLEAPDIVNDRFVELAPAYTGGAVLGAGGVIPTARTAVPVSTDAILRNLDQLVVDLGPHGANRHGAVSAAVAALARALGGNGPDLHTTVTSLGAAFGALASDGPQIKSLLDNLAVFTRSAAADSASYQNFVDDLAAVTDELASDNTDIAGALHNLQLALGALSQFVTTNRAAIGGTVSHLDTLFTTLAGEQRQLAATLGVAPTALANIAGAINPAAPGGPALVSRYDPTTGSETLAHQVCGDTLLRLLVVTVDSPPVSAGRAASGQASSVAASPLDVVCGFSSVLANLGAPPNAPSGPLTTLQTLTGAAP